MKPLKIVAIVAGALVALLAIGAIFVATQFDAERIKAEAARVVLEKKQRTLKIDGELELAFWPSLGVRIGKLSLSEHKNPQQEFAALEKAHVSVAVMPLLGGRIVADKVEIGGLRATVVKRKDGTLNIDDLLSKDEASEPVRFEVAAIKVTDAALTWRDEKAGSSTSVSGLALDTGRVAVDTGRQAYEVQSVALSARGKLDDDDFDIRFDAPRLALTPEGSGGENLSLTAKLAGKARSVDAKLALSGVSGKAGVLKADRLALDVDAKSGTTAVKATLASPLAAEFDAEKRKLALDKLAGSIDLAHPRLAKPLKLPLAGRAAVDLAKQTAELKLDTGFDETKVALQLDVRRFGPLALGFDLDIDRLDLDRYLPPQKAGAEEGKESGKLDFSALEKLELDGDVKVGSLQIAKVKAADVRLRVKASGGRLELAPHSAQLYGGTVNGSLSLNAKGNAVSLKENLAGINVGPLLKDAADKDLIEGRGNVALDVTTRGDSVAAMKKALAGSASLSLHDGALKGIDLARTFRELKARFSSKQDSEQQAKQTDKTDFSELKASFRIANGVAHNEDLTAKSPFLRLAGNGDIDVGNGRLDYLLKASVVATSGGQGAKDLEHLKGLTVPVRASGPFDKLSYRIEFAGLASEAVKAKVEEKTEAVKQQAKEKLLNGIFGR